MISETPNCTFWPGAGGKQRHFRWTPRPLRGCADDGDALTMRVAHGALAVLELGLGNYQSALRHGARGLRGRAGSEQGFRGETWSAAVRYADRQAAAAVLDAFSPGSWPAAPRLGPPAGVVTAVSL